MNQYLRLEIVTDALLSPALPLSLIPPQATSDEGMVELWLGNYRSPHTRRRYAADARAFLRFVAKPLRMVTVGDIQAFGASLAGGTTNTAACRLTGVKSLISLAHRLGYLPFDVGAPIQLPAVHDRLAERILTEFQVQQLLGLERRPRNAALLGLMYYAGLRISEPCGLCWRDFVARDEGAGQISVFGKGSKVRIILLPAPIWTRVVALRGDAGPDDPVFRSRQGGSLKPRQVHDIVKRAAKRAKLPATTSAHFLRHSHASHALDRGAPVHVVQTTLGHASLSTTTRYSHARPGDSSARYLTA
jgi:integrase/recombinase XerD